MIAEPREWGANPQILAAGQRVLELFTSVQGTPEQFPLWYASDSIAARTQDPASMPEHGQSLDDTLAQAVELMQQGLCNVSHPLYFGYISPRPHPAAVLGDFLGSALNQTPGAWRAGPSATMVEVEVLHALRSLFGLDPVVGRLPGGVFTGGGTLANLIGLKLAREQLHRQHPEMRRAGGLGPRIYMSREGHFSIAKALDVLGFAADALVEIDTDEQGALLPEQLELRLAHDVALGYTPMCLIGVLGTTATGAIDPLRRIGELARRYNAWFHIDGAAGLALAALPEARRHMQGLSDADSITFDPCKWMFASFGVGCLLVRNGEVLGSSFWAGGPYWEELGELDTFKMNLYGTRQFRSLGVWCLLQHLGLEGYRQLLRNMTGATAHLRALLSADPAYRLIPDQQIMPVVAFRPVTASAECVTRLVALCQQRNLAYPSVLEWNGERYIRVAISNYQTSTLDVERFKQALDGLLHELGFSPLPRIL